MAEVTEELKAAALAAFKPLVFTITSSTPHLVNVGYVVDKLSRDQAFAKNLFVIDVKNFTRDVKTPQAKTGRPGGGEGRSRAAFPLEATKGLGWQVFAEYLRLAIDRELSRRSAIEAQKEQLESLFQQYLEDGLGEEEARRAAEEELQECDDSDTGADTREQLFLCIRDYPQSVRDVLELSQENVSLHAVVDVQSKVPISPEESSERPRSARSGSRARSASISVMKKGRLTSEHRDTTLLGQLCERQQKLDRAYNAADEVVVHPYVFPADPVSGQTHPDGSPVYRPAISEQNGIAAVRDIIYRLEDLLHNYRAWVAHRTVAPVPAYAALPDPDAPKPPPVVEETERAGKARGVSPHGRRGSLTQLPTEVPSEPLTTPVHPRSMAEVAAPSEGYRLTALAARKDGHHFTVGEFVKGCFHQVATCRGESLPTKEQASERVMLQHRDAAGRYARYLIQQTLGSIGAPTGAEQKPAAPALDDPLSGTVDEQPTVPAADGAVVGDGESLRDAIRRALEIISPHLPPAIVNEQIDEVLSNVVSKVRGEPDRFVSQQLTPKNAEGWRHVSTHWGDYCLEVLSRGDGCPRTQHTVYAFDQPTTLPMFHECLNFCAAEYAYFYPPPPDSDAEESSSESSTEEDEEDEEGNIVPRKKKEPEPFPILDHVNIIQDALRRRRTYEEMKGYTSVPVRQELVSAGLGCHGAVDEVEWMFPADGSIVEVSRSVCNTRQLYCTVMPLTGMRFGFQHYPAEGRSSGACVPPVIPCGVRTDVFSGDDLHVMAEVVADNSVEADRATYEAAVAAAKREAATQFEGLSAGSKSSRRDKRGTPQLTLASLEDACIAAVPKPKVREKDPPTIQLIATVKESQCTAVLDESTATLLLSSYLPADLQRRIPMRVMVWRNGHVEVQCVPTFSHLKYFMGGCLEIISSDADGYRILLGAKGTYMTSKDGTSLFVAASGQQVLNRGGVKTLLTPMKVAMSVDCTTKNCLRQREDVGQILYSGCGDLVSVSFNEDVRAMWTDGRCTWHISGYPPVHCDPSAGQLSLHTGFSSLIFDRQKHAVALKRSCEDTVAVFDLVNYRLEVRTASLGSTFTLDCAFGGLCGQVVDGTASTVYRVSPLGRCSEERNSVLAYPTGYVTPELQAVVQHREVLCPLFENALKDSSLDVSCDALHLMASYTPPSLNWDPTEASLVVPSQDPVKDYFASKIQHELQSLIRSNGKSHRALLCCTIALDDNRRVNLLPTSYFTTMLRDWQRHANAQYTHPHPLSTTSSTTANNTTDYALAVRADNARSNAPYKSSLPTSVFSRPSSIQPVRGASEEEALDWYIVLQREATVEEGHIAASLEHDAVERGVEAARRALAEAVSPSFTPSTLLSPTVRPQAGAIVSQAASRPILKLVDKKVPHGARGRLHFWEFRAAPATIAAAPVVRHDAERSLSTKPANNYSPTLLGAIHSTVKGAVRIPILQPHFPQSVDMGTTASTRGHSPDLSLYPAECHFGSVVRQRRYCTHLNVTNVATVPCRYRVAVPCSLKEFLSVGYPKRFIPPGMTVSLEVRLSGWQPLGEKSVSLQLSHEGGTVIIPLTWRTVPPSREEALALGVMCAGPSEYPFEPGTIKRFKPRDPDNPDEEMEEEASTTDSQPDVLASI